MIHCCKPSSWTLLSLLIACAVGCAGPERAPHQPITGIDRPASERAANPYDDDDGHDEDDTDRERAAPHYSSPRQVPTPGDGGSAQRLRPPADNAGGLVEDFVADLAAVIATKSGKVAVFWPLSKHPGKTGARHVTLLGERLADEIADGLQSQGVEAVAGDTLIHALSKRNRSLRFYRDVSDAFDLGERVGARYVVYGTVDKISYSRINRDERLDLRLRIRDVLENREVTSWRTSVTGGALGRDLMRDFVLASDVRIADEAPQFMPRPDAEANVLMGMLARRTVVKHGVQLEGKRVVVEPTLIRAVSGRRAEVQALMEAFDRAYSASFLTAQQAGVANPELAALEQPFKYGTDEFDKLEEALDLIKSEQIKGRAAAPEELSTDLARALTESLKEAGGAFDIVAGETGRQAILSVIHREAAAYRKEEAVDAGTITQLRQQGAQFLVRSTLRSYLGGYQLRVMIYDMKTNKAQSEVIDFDPMFKSDLDAFTT